MADQQQQEAVERTAADIESGMAVVPAFENEDVPDDPTSPASSYRDLYNRMSTSQHGSGTLPPVCEHGLAQKSTLSTSSSCCSSLGDIGASERFGGGDCETDDEDILPPPYPTKRTVSTVSNVTDRYDLTGKGYLDDAERAMRNLDTENRGTLDMNKVYLLMNDMLKQQTVLHEQQKSFANLKRVVVVLACFSVILALANMGTAFAAATLAKDTTVDAATGSLLAKGSGEHISTLATGSVIHVEASTVPENVYDRRLKTGTSILVGKLGGLLTGDEQVELLCPHPAVGEITRSEMVHLFLNIRRAVSNLNIQYKFADEITGETTDSELFLRIEESNFSSDNLHIGCTRTFPCTGTGCETAGSYRTGREDFTFERVDNKYLMYSCHVNEPVPMPGVGIGPGEEGFYGSGGL